MIKMARKAKQIQCPKCKSTDFRVLNDTKKSLSFGKAAAGYILAGPLGAAGGAIIGKKGKYDLICNKCGYRWIQKK